MKQLYRVVEDCDGIRMSEPIEKAAAEKLAAEFTQKYVEDKTTFSAIPYCYQQRSWNNMGGATHRAGEEVYDTSTMQEVFPPENHASGRRAFDYDHIEVDYIDGTTRWFVPNEPIEGSVLCRLL